jgi:hypothetical protein
MISRRCEDERGNLGIGRERLLLDRLRGIEPGLLAIARQGPDERRFAPRARQREDETIEAVAFGAPGPDRGKCLFELAPSGLEIDRLAIGAARLDVVDEHALGGMQRRRLQLQFKIDLRIDEQAHLLEDRHCRR